MSSSTPPQGDVTPSQTPAPQADPAQDVPSAAAVDATPVAEQAAEPAPGTAPGTKSDTARVDVQAVAAQLKELFPALFTGGAKPLKLRVQSDIQERAPGKFTKAQLSAFLRRYTGGTGYLIALSKAKNRFDLDGQPAGELSDEHREAAKQELTRRRGIVDARRAEEDRGREERAQLLRDFSRTTLTPANFCALKGMTQEQLDAQLAQAREEEAQQPPRPERFDRQDRGPRGGDQRRGGPRGDGPRGEGRPGQGPRGDRGNRDDRPRRDGQGRPNDGRKPPRQPG